MTQIRGALVVAEIALAVVLLSAAGLLIKSFVALHNVALGFRPENVLVMKTALPAPLPRVRQFFKDVLPQVVAIPGVVAAGAPLAGCLQVKPDNPIIYVGVAALLGLVTLFAGYVPARRASSIDPLIVLRQE